MHTVIIVIFFKVHVTRVTKVQKGDNQLRKQCFSELAWLIQMLYDPLVSLQESDLTFRLASGLVIWQPMWEHRQPEVSAFTALVKPIRNFITGVWHAVLFQILTTRNSPWCSMDVWALYAMCFLKNKHFLHGQIHMQKLHQFNCNANTIKWIQLVCGDKPTI